MSDRPGDPRSVRHLRPNHVPGRHPSALTDEPMVREDVISVDELEEQERQLKLLREPFPPEMVEKLPKPTFRDAWQGKKAASCKVCHGYHVLDNCIHLDYVGHANVTNRLLEADPFWEWEPMAYTPEGTPYFSDGGLWIKLTVCGMTRIGYGDGKNVKEVIGDAIRNAAMRFGVALDLWSKIDLHAERNPGNGETSQGQRELRPGRGSDRGGRKAPAAAGGDAGKADTAVASNPARAANQDALDSLLSVCQEYKFKPNEVEKRFQEQHPWGIALVTADPEEIMEFAAKLIAEASTEGGDDTEAVGAGAGDGDADAERADDDPLADSAPTAATTDDLF